MNGQANLFGWGAGLLYGGEREHQVGLNPTGDPLALATNTFFIFTTNCTK
jgi:hypothetical protein